MRVWWLALAVVLVASSAPAASAQMCKIESKQYGTVEYPCGSGESGPSAPKEETPWYQSLDIWLGVLGLVGSAGAGGFAIYRVRTRRRALSVTLAAIESTYAEAKADPEAGIAKLGAMRTTLREEHQKGRLDDVHFLELDRRATQYLVKLRILEIDRRFPTLAPLFLAEIRRLLSDGVLSVSEADLIEVRAAAYRVPEPARSELIQLTRRWANEDAPTSAPSEAALAQ